MCHRCCFHMYIFKLFDAHTLTFDELLVQWRKIARKVKCCYLNAFAGSWLILVFLFPNLHPFVCFRIPQGRKTQSPRTKGRVIVRSDRSALSSSESPPVIVDIC